MMSRGIRYLPIWPNLPYLYLQSLSICNDVNNIYVIFQSLVDT